MNQLHVDIAEYLLGTCKGVSDAAEQFDVDEDTVNAAVDDQEIFLCDQCGWWCEVSEMSDSDYAESTGDQICDDCGNEG